MGERIFTINLQKGAELYDMFATTFAMPLRRINDIWADGPRQRTTDQPGPADGQEKQAM